MSHRRTVFFVSDGTGITAQMLGHSLLTQFEGVDFKQVTLPFVDSTEKAEECISRIATEEAQAAASQACMAIRAEADKEIAALHRKHNNQTLVTVQPGLRRPDTTAGASPVTGQN